MFPGEFNPTEQGTPQAGVVSPLLANRGLHQLETYIKTTNPQLGVVRYADDFMVTATDKGSLEKAQIQIQQWMKARGLELSAEQTAIRSMKDGFDFLGFVRHEVAFMAVMTEQSGHNLVFCYQHSTKTCG